MRYSIFIIFLLLISVPAHATTYFVKTDGSDGNDGLSWDNAKLTIQAAVDAATEGDVILVEYGQYNISDDIDITSNRKLTSDDGTGTGWDDASPDSSQCRINPANQHRIFDVYGAAITNETRIRGFKLEEGRATTNQQGGGLRIGDGAAPIIENNWFALNSATASGTGYGGAIYCENSDPIIQYNNIENNDANSLNGDGYGGGICCYGSDAIIRYNRIANNVASYDADAVGYGGGLYLNGGSPTVLGNIIYTNHANDDNGYPSDGYGGGICTIFCNSTIIHNIFRKNVDSDYSPSYGGSGLYRDGGTVTVKNNIFMDHDDPDSDKRAIYSYQTGFYVQYNCFYNNPNDDYNVTYSNCLFDTDPLVDLTNYELYYNSPCIEAGETNFTYNETENHDKGWKEDMGAYEYQETRIRKDVSGTGEILFGGQVRAKINVVDPGTVTAFDIIVHPNDNHAQSSVSVKRWYEIEQVPAGSSGEFEITFSYKDSELNGNTENQLEIYRYDSGWDGPKIPASRNTTENWLRLDNQGNLEGDWIFRSPGATFYVDATRPHDGGDGQSWATAKKSIQAAVDASTQGEVILVKYGTYYLTNHISLTTDRIIVSDDGNGTGWQDAEPDSSQCTIDANNNCRIFYMSGSSVTNETYIKGFEITGGFAGDSGGGILIENGASPIIENCHITNNHATDSGGSGRFGGGICSLNSSPIIRYNKIINNLGTSSETWDSHGGGIYTAQSTATIRYNIIKDNTSANNYLGFGGGIYSYKSNDVIEHNVLDNNISGMLYPADCRGSGICLWDDGVQPVVKNNVIMNHTQSDQQSIYAYYDNAVISHNCFYNNPNGNAGNITSTNEVNGDPMFTNPGSNDYTLTYQSPCIDGGEEVFDYDESSNHHLGWREDIGLYEYSGERVRLSLDGTGETYFGGKVRAKVNVTQLTTAGTIDINVHPAETHSNGQGSVQRWYDITNTGFAGTFDITLSYKDNELNGNTETDLNLYRQNGTLWEYGGSDNASTEENWVKITGQDQFSQWILQSPMAVDPTNGTALEFDGVDERAEIPYDSSLNPAGSFTVEAWAKLTVSNGNNKSIISTHENSSGRTGFFIEIATDQLTGGVGNGTSWAKVTGSSWSLDQWHHVALVYDDPADEVRLYQDGELVGSATLTSPALNSQDLWVGGSQFYGNHFPGIVDEVRFWNLACTETQLRENMHTVLDDTQINLQGYWQINDGSGSATVSDIASNGNHGTLTNMNSSEDWIDSTIPLGDGICNSAENVQNSQVNLGNISLTDAGFDGADNFDNPVDITAAEIYDTPETPPTTDAVLLDDRYFVANLFGSAGDYNSRITFALPQGFIEAKYDEHPDKIKLYRREKNGDSDTWSEIAATTVISAEDKVTFEITNIMGTGQFTIGKVQFTEPSTGTALAFDGIDDYAEILHSDIGNPAASFTVEAWVKLTETSTGRSTIISKHANPSGRTGYFMEFDWGTGKMNVGVGDGSSWTSIQGTTAWQLNQWHHVALVYSQPTGELKFYEDGDLINVASVPSDGVYNEQDLWIGGSEFYGNYIPGVIDEVRLWYGVRSANNIRENMYNAVSAGETHLAGYWQFNDETGTLLSDARGNHGTLYNMDDTDWVESTIPFGDGSSTSATGVQNSSGIVLGNITIADGGFSGADGFDSPVDVTVTEILNAPYNPPTVSGELLSDRYFVIDVFGTPGTYNARVTFGLPDGFVGPEDEATPSNLKMYKRDSGSDGSWDGAYGAIAASAGDNTATFELNDAIGFSQFTISDEDDTPLPVELQDFYAEVIPSGIRLHWTTASELNNKGFIVYKQWQQGSLLPCSDLIEGAGTTSEPQEYSFTDKTVQPNVLYTYQIADVEEGTNKETLHPPITIMATKEALQAKEIPQAYKLHASYPNPFNPTTTIEFDVPVGTYNYTSLRIYDVSGKFVKTLVDEPMEPGYHSVIWDGKDDNGKSVNSGVYIYKMMTENYHKTRRCILLK